MLASIPKSLAVAFALLVGTACSSSFGLQEKPNEWALACESVDVMVDDQASDGARDGATDQLAALLETYGGDYEGGAFEALVRPVVDGAEADDLEPARKFNAANC